MIFFLKRVYMPLVKKSYYHGSATEIQDDALMPKEQWNSVQNARVKGAFVTSDKNYAKFLLRQYKQNDIVSVKGEGYKVKLMEASSGFQSIVPLYLVSLH